MKRETKKLANFYADKQMLTNLKNLSEKIGIPQSVIMREAVTEKIAELTARVRRGESVSLGVVTR
jgi:predicted DNA-binding protein